ncbi:MAG: hypothetical protein OEM01_05650 [Desulfobulbaceae bacterium]|nr:hypothetical protein [Desulfobulbaceae bacterium]
MFSAVHRVRYFIFAVFINLLAALVMHGVSPAAVMPDYVHLAPVTKTVNGPAAMAFDRQGLLYVAEPGSDRVVVLSRSGRYIAALTGLGTPVSVAVDAGGRILVGSKEKGSVQVYDTDFTPLFKLGSGDGEFSWPNDICIDATGRIYVVDRGNDIVMLYDSSGQFTGFLGSPGNSSGQFYRPVSMTVDEAAGEIIVLDRQLVAGTAKQGARVQFFTMAGAYLRGFTRNSDQEGGMVMPQGITVDTMSRIYVADSYQNAVLVYDNTGIFLGAVYDPDNPLRAPLGITINRASRLYVASRMAKSIEVYGIDDYTNMAADPAEIDFKAKHGGGSPAAKSISIHNIGTTAINWDAFVNDGWLSISGGNGVLDQGQAASFDVEADTTGLAPGEYTGRITVSAGPVTVETVDVVLKVTPAAKLSATPAALSLASEVGISPDSVTMTINNSGSAPLNWSISSDRQWLSAGSDYGTVSAGAAKDVALLADVTLLTAGTYTGTITVSGNDALDIPGSINVTLILSDPVPDPPPSLTPPAGTTWQGNSGRKWSVVFQLAGTSLNSIWGSSGTDIFAVGDSGTVLHFDGKSWNEENTGTSTDLYGVWGASAARVYAVGESGLVLHYDGENWSTTFPVPDTLHTAWCGSNSTCLAAGQNTSILAGTDPLSWSPDYSGDAIGSLHGIWGSSESDLYVVGDGGIILHNDGQGWSFINSGTDRNLQSVWGSGADNVFAVGQGGTILRYNGMLWKPMASGTTVTLLGVWGNAANEVYAVGEDGTMLLYQGSNWRKLETGVAETLNDAWGSRRKEIYAVGADGSILLSRKYFPWRLLLPALSHNGK